MKGEARCSIKEASLVQGEVSAQRADGGIDGIVNNREQCSSLCLPDTIPQSKIRDFCQPPGGELAVGQERPAWAVTQGGLSSHLTASAVVGHHTQAKENSMSL